MNRYGHVKKMADAEAEGAREAGYEVDMYQYASHPFIVQS
jgi:multimeric flavodoxin WrbA